MSKLKVIHSQDDKLLLRLCMYVMTRCILVVLCAEVVGATFSGDFLVAIVLDADDYKVPHASKVLF